MMPSKIAIGRITRRTAFLLVLLGGIFPGSSFSANHKAKNSKVDLSILDELDKPDKPSQPSGKGPPSPGSAPRASEDSERNSDDNEDTDSKRRKKPQRSSFESEADDVLKGSSSRSNGKKSGSTARIEAKWIGPNGEVLNLDWPVRHRWVFAKYSKKEPAPSPILRTWVQIPPQYTYQSAKASSAVRVIPNPKGHPLGGGGKVIAIDTRSPVSTVTLQVTNQDERIEEFGLLLQVRTNQTPLLVHESCADYGIQVTANTTSATFMYAGASCVRRDATHLGLLIAYSNDAAFNQTSFERARGEGNNWAYFDLVIPDEVKEPPLMLGSYQIREKAGVDSNQYRVSYEPPKPKSRFMLMPGFAFSYLTYKETPLNVQLTELALTLKLTLSFPLISDFIDAGGNVFGNAIALPMSRTPSNLTAARFFGVNARIGLKLPIKFSYMTFRLLTGWYYWGMKVSDGSYGLKSLYGPQIFLMASGHKPNTRPYWCYFKFSPIGSSFSSINLANRELALGLGYQLSSPFAKRPWALTVDLSSTQFDSAKLAGSLNTNAIDLVTGSIGLQLTL